MKKNSVAKNYFYNLINQILAIIIALITIPYLARILGAEKLGIYNYTLSIVTYFILIGSLGIALYGQKEIAYVQDNLEKRSKTFYEIFLMKCCTMIISLILFYIFFCIKGKYKMYYSILIMEILANIIDISWFLEGLEEFKKTIVRNMIVKIISLVLIIYFIKNESDLYKYFWIYVLTNINSNISLWFFIPKFTKKIKFKELNLLRHLKPCIILFIPQIATQIYTVLDKTMIGSIVSDISEVTYYEQPQKMIKIALSFITALGTVMLPRVACFFSKKECEKIKNTIHNSFGFAAMLSIPMTLGFIAISNSLIPCFLGHGYEKAKIILKVIAPIIIFVSFSNVIGIQYLLPTKRDRNYTFSVISGAITNLIANFILIKIFKSIGAAFATDIAELVVLLVMIIYTRKDFNYKEIFKNLLKYCLFGIIMFTFCIMIEILLKPSFICMVIQVIIGLIVYLALLILTKDKLFYSIFNKIFRNKSAIF